MRKAMNARCWECPLKQYALCPSYGPRNPKLIVVGEGPGLQEILYMRPFVGATGGITRQLVAQAGIDPTEETFYTNTVLCTDPQSSGDKKAKQMAVAVPACQGRLQAALELLPDDVPVVALGYWARKALGVEMNHWEREKLTGKHCIGTKHPAAALYEPGALVHTEKVMEKVAAFVSGHSASPPPGTDAREVVVLDNQPDLEALEYLHSTTDPICIDIETTDTDWTHPDCRVIRVGISTTAVPGCDPRTVGTRGVIFTEDNLNDPLVRKWLQNLTHVCAHRIGGHNYKFDNLAMTKHLGIDLNTYAWDTMLMANIYHELWLKDLKGLCQYYFDVDDWAERLVHSQLRHICKAADRTFDKVPPDKLNEYLSLDIHLNLLLYEQLKEELENVDRFERPYQEFEMPLAHTLTAMEYRGFAVDEARLKPTQEKLDEALNDLKLDVQATSGGALENPGSPKQVAKHLWENLKVPYPHSAGKYPSTKEAVLLGIKDPPAIVSMILKYRRASKMRGSYIKNVWKFLRPDEAYGVKRVHPTYKQAHVRTGRLSAGKPSGPAIQTIPGEDARKDGDAAWGKLIKMIYTVPDGYILVLVDGSQWELRVATVLSEDPWMVNAYKSGMDVHGLACDAIYGVGKWTKAQRKVEKNCMFGTLYGGKVESLVSVGTLTLTQKRWVVDFFYEELKRMAEWREEVFARACKDQVLISPYFNRAYHFPLVTPSNLHEIRKWSLNYLVQGTASQITLDAAVHARPALEGAHFVVTVHDSNGLEAPIAQAVRATEIMGQELEAAGTRFSDIIPWVADAEVGFHWGHMMEYDWKQQRMLYYKE